MAAVTWHTVQALLFVNVCRGGTDFARATSGGNSTACTMSCYQMPVGYCGGPLANTIYTQTLAAVPSPSPTPSPSPSPAPQVNSTLNITSYGESSPSYHQCFHHYMPTCDDAGFQCHVVRRFAAAVAPGHCHSMHPCSACRIWSA